MVHVAYQVAPKATLGNKILAALPPNEYQRILPHLEEVDLVYNSRIVESGDRIRHIYFPNSGCVSVLADVQESRILVACVVGREGMAGGLALFLGSRMVPLCSIVMGEGTAMRMGTKDFQDECGHHGALPEMLKRFAYSSMIQLVRSSVCYQSHSIEERIARWLLMIFDRMEANEFLITQRFMSALIGVSRESVTFASLSLRKKNLISYSRGNMIIIDRPGLEAAACNCYKIICDAEDSLSTEIV